MFVITSPLVAFNYPKAALPLARLSGALIFLSERGKTQFADAAFYRWSPSYKASGMRLHNRKDCHNRPKTTQPSEWVDCCGKRNIIGR